MKVGTKEISDLSIKEIDMFIDAMSSFDVRSIPDIKLHNEKLNALNLEKYKR